MTYIIYYPIIGHDYVPAHGHFQLSTANLDDDFCLTVTIIGDDVLEDAENFSVIINASTSDFNLAIDMPDNEIVIMGKSINQL